MSRYTYLVNQHCKKQKSISQQFLVSSLSFSAFGLFGTKILEVFSVFKSFFHQLKSDISFSYSYPF